MITGDPLSKSDVLRSKLANRLMLKKLLDRRCDRLGPILFSC